MRGKRARALRKSVTSSKRLQRNRQLTPYEYRFAKKSWTRKGRFCPVPTARWGR